MDFTVLFPMAGRGVRFGGVFKPFLAYGEELFIEAAVRPFRTWAARIPRFYFVYLTEQEEAFGVRRELERRFTGLPFDTVLLDRPTRGPAETISRAVAAREITGAALVCDCDHSLDVSPLFEAPRADVVLPTWSLDGERAESWSIAAIAPDGRVTAIAEKRHPDAGGVHRGVIGCYGFADIADVARRADTMAATNFSDVINAYLAEGRDVRAVAIQRAEFFGDPARLERALETRSP